MGHGGLLVSAALVAELAKMIMRLYQDSEVSEARDILDEIDKSGQ